VLLLRTPATAYVVPGPVRTVSRYGSTQACTELGGGVGVGVAVVNGGSVWVTMGGSVWVGVAGSVWVGGMVAVIVTGAG
jgi:hypothetical protein